MMRRPSGLAVVVCGLVAFLYVPLVVVVLFAFNSGVNLTWPLEGLSTRWFEQVFSEDAFRNAFLTSLRVALITALIAAAIGTAAALLFTRHRTWPARIVEACSILPVMLPPLLIGVALLAAFSVAGILTSTATVILGHLVFVIPYVVLIVAARMRGTDLELELAARDLGARPLQVLRRITLPLIAPAVAGAALLAIAFSFDEVLITNFTVGLDSTLPLLVFSRLRRTVDPSINAVATILMTMPWIALASALLILRRSFSFGRGGRGPVEESG